MKKEIGPMYVSTNLPFYLVHQVYCKCLISGVLEKQPSLHTDLYVIYVKLSE